MTAYSLQNAVADLVGMLDALGIDAADIVAHDWGAPVAWLTAAAHQGYGADYMRWQRMFHGK